MLSVRLQVFVSNHLRSNPIDGRPYRPAALPETYKVWWPVKPPFPESKDSSCSTHLLLQQVIHFHPRFQELIRDAHIPVTRFGLHLGNFGSPSQKPISLYTSEQWIAELKYLKLQIAVPPTISSETPVVNRTVDEFGDLDNNSHTLTLPNGRSMIACQY